MLSVYRTFSPDVRRLVPFFATAPVAADVAMFASLLGAPKQDPRFGKTAHGITRPMFAVIVPTVLAQRVQDTPMQVDRSTAAATAAQSLTA